jgi:RNA polymerase sigma-70 factor (ECF subfamily)
VVYRYVLARVGSEPLAEDLTSEVFFAVLEGIRTVRAQDELGFAAWLLGIARNTVSMHYRKVRIRPEEPHLLLENQHLIATAEEGDPLMIITARESWAEVAAGLNQLTEEQRAVVLYRCVLGYSAEDTAKLLKKRPGAVRALQFRALASLTRYLEMAEETPKHGRTSAREGEEG